MVRINKQILLQLQANLAENEAFLDEEFYHNFQGR